MLNKSVKSQIFGRAEGAALPPERSRRPPTPALRQRRRRRRPSLTKPGRCHPRAALRRPARGTSAALSRRDPARCSPSSSSPTRSPRRGSAGLCASCRRGGLPSVPPVAATRSTHPLAPDAAGLSSPPRSSPLPHHRSLAFLFGFPGGGGCKFGVFFL